MTSLSAPALVRWNRRTGTEDVVVAVMHNGAVVAVSEFQQCAPS